MKWPLYLCAGLAIGGGSLLLAQPSGERCIGEFATSLKGRTKNQRHNAILAVNKLKEVVIPAGGEFSFNGAVGTYSVDAGYRKAPVSYNGQLLKGWGGGVCQTSTTLYNAALLSGMEIVDRSKHRFAPSYAPPGRDSAVAYPNIDLKFRNPYEFPVRIRGTWQGDLLKVGIFASRGPEVRPAIVTQVIDTSSPTTISLTRPSEVGRVRNTGKVGFEVITYRIRGNQREFISRDTYPAMHRVVESHESD